MDIEHLVMSGGGPVFGLYMYGALNHLFNNTMDVFLLRNKIFFPLFLNRL